MMQDQPTPSAAERAYESLRARILDGAVPPGTMLGESALASELGMSRTPVRAALSRLQDEGWITIYPKRGALVRGLGQRTITELAESRALLESAAQRRVAVGDRAGIAARLDGLVEDQRAALTRRDLSAFVGLLQEFHRGFVEAGGNQVMLELYDRLADRHRFALSSDGEALFARAEEGLDEHSVLVECFRSGDSERFERTLHAHVAENGAPREAA